MTMIDCHAHAFPTLTEMADELPPGVADVLRAAVSPMAQALADEVANRVPGGQRLKRDDVPIGFVPVIVDQDGIIQYHTNSDGLSPDRSCRIWVGLAFGVGLCMPV